MTDGQELYGLPLSGFVRARGALAKDLRKAGRREDADAVSSLRKPSVAAWTVNQLVRSQRREVAALFDAGDGLQHAQSELLAGSGDRLALREAVAREREAVAELAERARGLLSSEGHELTQATLDRVSETLHAAALDADARAQVKDGCLARELRHVGLGAGGAANPPASRSGGRSGASKRTAANTSGTPASVTRERTGVANAQANRERAQRLKAARKAEADTRRGADRAGRQLRTAQARRDDAEAALRKAEEALAEAREQAERAAVEHQRAQQALDRL